MIIAIAASVLSIVWVSLAFGSFPLVGVQEPLRSILLIIVDVVVVTLGVVGFVRARRARESYLLPFVIVCTPAAHWLGSLIRGEIIILFLSVPALVLAIVTCVEGLRRLFMRRRQAL